jgi:cytochrome c biogenesis protein CcmG, thiol:disulfide interchange protein DsbE
VSVSRGLPARWTRWAPGIAILAVVGLALRSPAWADDRAPPTVDLADYRGKVVVLDFWASWCAPCRESFPFLESLRQRHERDGLVVIGINLDTEREAAARFLAATPVGFRIAYDPSGEIAAHYELRGMPSSFFFARDGSLRLQHTGFRRADRQTLAAAVVQLLEEKTP